MISPAILDGPRLKVERAYRHIDEIIQRSSPLDNTLYEITYDHHAMFPDLKEPGLYVHYRPLKCISETFGLMIGDAVHNLRAALDHLSTGICRSIDPTAKPYFPMDSNRAKLISHASFPLLERALPAATRLILEKLRPENGPNETLWRFNALDNDDKHNLILPTLTVTGISGINITDKGNTVSDCGVFGDASTVIGIYGAPYFTGTINGDAKVAVDLHFGAGTPFEHRPVVSTLTEIAALVSDVIDQFAKLVLVRTKRNRNYSPIRSKPNINRKANKKSK